MPVLMSAALRLPVVMKSATKPSPVPNVRQSHEPSALVPGAIRKPCEHTCMALPPDLVGLPSESMGTLAHIVPRSKLVWQ